MVTAARSPRVSVIVPVRDRRAMLRDLLAALEQQTFRAFEVIVVDDASTDGSADEAEAAAERGVPVQVVRRTDGGGAVAARLAGVEQARGEVLAFTDSDCVPSPRWLEQAMSAIDEGADLVQGLTRPTGPVGPLERSVWAEREDGLYATCNVLYRRSAYERARGFVPDGGALFGFRAGQLARGLGFGEDSLLGWRVRRSGRTAFVPDAVVEHQVLPFEARGAVSRAWQAGGFPALVREVPELRETLLDHRYLLGRRGQLWLLGAVAAAVLRRPRLAVLAGGLWVRAHARRIDRTTDRWPVELVGVLALDAVSEAALLAGAVRARVLVL
jgi:glycosyltransferase involved in cell wall biosynthesis